MLEREVKLRFGSPDEARRAVRATGAVMVRSRRLQEDALLDTPDRTLAQRGCVVRIRNERGTSLITFKGPVQPGAMKVRPEYETAVADGTVVERILAQLGLEPWFRYEKYREEYSADEVTIAIDETPVGTFVELEGDEAGIHRLTQALGRTADDFILDSYRSLFVQHRTRYGYDTADMLFLDSEE